MDGDRPIVVGGDPPVTGMAITMGIGMGITVAIVLAIVQDIMQVVVTLTQERHPTQTGPCPPIMYIKIVRRGLQEPGTIVMIQRQATRYQQLIAEGPLHSRPTRPTMFIQTGTEMFTARKATTGTG